VRPAVVAFPYAARWDWRPLCNSTSHNDAKHPYQRDADAPKPAPRWSFCTSQHPQK